jgi:hypothetical protein
VGIELDSVENVTGTSWEDLIVGDDGPNRLSASPQDEATRATS